MCGYSCAHIGIQEGLGFAMLPASSARWRVERRWVTPQSCRSSGRCITRLGGPIAGYRGRLRIVLFATVVLWVETQISIYIFLSVNLIYGAWCSSTVCWLLSVLSVKYNSSLLVSYSLGICSEHMRGHLYYFCKLINTGDYFDVIP